MELWMCTCATMNADSHVRCQACERAVPSGRVAEPRRPVGEGRLARGGAHHAW
jgi:hypothetical protein